MNVSEAIEQVGAQDKAESEKVAVTVTEKAKDEEDSLGDEVVVQPLVLEVQSGVGLIEDDVNMPAETFRAYTIGLTLTLMGASIGNITELREQPLVISPTIIQLIALPLGRYWAKYMPEKRLSLGKWSLKLNPGPFTIKEHTLIVAMANVGVSPPYVVGLMLAQMTKFNQNFGFLYNILLLTGTEMLGYGLAGVCRRWLVYPSDMIWPEVFQTTTFLNTMHRDKNEPVGSWTISRYRLFFLSMGGMFIYSWLPQCIGLLSSFEIITLIWPQSKIVNTVFGAQQGMGLFAMTLSYQTVIAFLSSPQFVPFFAHLNIFAGMAFWFWLVAGLMYLTNHWWSQYFPIGSPLIYTNTGAPYNVSRIATKDALLDLEEYKSYSPLFQGPRIALAYALSFASISCVLVHTALYEGKTLIRRLNPKRNPEEDDVHMRAMRNYPEVPEWWYQVLLAFLFTISMISVVAWPTHLPWWGFIITFLLPVIFTIPIGIIQARSAQQLGLNVITEFVAGYIWPGRPVANLLVKIYGYMTMNRGLGFVGDLKMGMYMRIPPRAMFRFQVVGSFASNLTAVSIITALIKAVPGLCEPKNPQGFTCPGQNVFYRASIIWGLIAPDRIFSPKAPYGESMWYFLIGALTPIPFYLALKKWPNSWVKLVNMPLFFSGTGMIPPATPLNYSSWAAVGIFFNGWVMSRHPAWWSKYNYILASGLSIGVVLVELIFAFLGVGGIEIDDLFTDPLKKWTGRTLDSNDGAIFRKLADGEIIGPKTWS